jgi:hypothetical protein
VYRLLDALDEVALLGGGGEDDGDEEEGDEVFAGRVFQGLYFLDDFDFFG